VIVKIVSIGFFEDPTTWDEEAQAEAESFQRILIRSDLLATFLYLPNQEFLFRKLLDNFERIRQGKKY